MKRWKWAGISALSVLTVMVLSRFMWWFVAQRLPQLGFEVRAAAFGDIAGAIFSALAFAGLIVTTLMQNRELFAQRAELSLQREELKETREELRRSANAQEAAEKALQAQVDTARMAAKLNALASLLNSVEIDPATTPRDMTDPTFESKYWAAKKAVPLKEEIQKAITELDKLSAYDAETNKKEREDKPPSANPS